MPEDVNTSLETTEPEVDISVRLSEANERKAEGNEHFRSGQWSEALVAYRSALGLLPRRSELPPKFPYTQEGDPDSESATPANDSELTEDNSKEVVQPETVEQKEIKEQCAKARAVLNANIGACYVKLGDHKQAADACGEALRDDPKYVKALQRRAASNDIIDSWTSLTAAQEDYNTLLQLAATPAEIRTLEGKLRQLKPRIEVAQKKETGEMLDKLKGLGNSILGNFGLSTDNFKFEPNGQGGYAVNFSR